MALLQKFIAFRKCFVLLFSKFIIWWSFAGTFTNISFWIHLFGSLCFLWSKSSLGWLISVNVEGAALNKCRFWGIEKQISYFLLNTKTSFFAKYLFLSNWYWWFFLARSLRLTLDSVQIKFHLKFWYFSVLLTGEWKPPSVNNLTNVAAYPLFDSPTTYWNYTLSAVTYLYSIRRLWKECNIQYRILTLHSIVISAFAECSN